MQKLSVILFLVLSGSLSAHAENYVCYLESEVLQIENNNGDKKADVYSYTYKRQEFRDGQPHDPKAVLKQTNLKHLGKVEVSKRSLGRGIEVSFEGRALTGELTFTKNLEVTDQGKFTLVDAFGTLTTTTDLECHVFQIVR